jgi:hypothetical protein
MPGMIRCVAVNLIRTAVLAGVAPNLRSAVDIPALSAPNNEVHQADSLWVMRFMHG